MTNLLQEDDHFLTLLKDIAGSNGLSNYTISFKNNGSTTEGFITQIIQAEIVSASTTLYLIIKCCSSEDKIRNLLPIKKIFDREVFFYETVVPTFRRFEIEHGINPTKFTAKYYKSYRSDSHDAIVLRNIKKCGFRLHSNKRLLNDNHIRLAIKSYAKFHAISFAFRQQCPLEFNKLTDSMEDYFPEWFRETGFMESLTKQLQKAVSELDPEKHHNVKIRSEKFISRVRDYILELPSMLDDFLVVVHGDCWQNNLLFKYEDDTEPAKATDVRHVDFQLSRLSSPMIDIANLFYACGAKEVVDDMKDYLKFYYSCLESHLKALGSDVQKVYPFEVMMRHWKTYAPFGLVIRASTIVVTLSEDNEHVAVSDVLESGGKVEDMINYKIFDKEKYREICTHMLVHFVENEFI